jgi:hypothetical protein
MGIYLLLLLLHPRLSPQVARFAVKCAAWQMEIMDAANKHILCKLNLTLIYVEDKNWWCNLLIYVMTVMAVNYLNNDKGAFPSFCTILSVTV